LAKRVGGKLVATDDKEAWARSLALATNSNLDRLFVGGMRVDQKYNPETGEVLTNADKTESYKDGKRIDTGDRVNATPGILQRIMENIKKEHPDWNENQVLNEAKKRVAQFNKNMSLENGKEDVALNGGELLSEAVGLLETYGIVGVPAVAILEGVTKKGVKLKDEEWKKGGAVFKEADPEKGISGGWYKDGRRVGDMEGFILKPDGERLEKGIVTKKWEGTKKTVGKIFDKTGEKVGSVFSSFRNSPSETSNKTLDSSDNSSNGKNNTQIQNSPDNDMSNQTPHNQTPSNQSTSSINDGNQNVKSPAREKFEDIIQNKEKELSKNYAAGKINDDEFKKQSVALEGIKHKLENGQPINYGDLKNAGINVSDLQEKGFIFKTNDKGNITGIDFGKSNEILGNAQNKFDLNKMLKDFAYQEAVNDHIDKVKENLIKSGKYSPDDEFIKQIDSIQEKINKGELKVSDLVKNAKTLSERHT
jgi:hypothetical protein